jgi:hypothetical protein
MSPLLHGSVEMEVGDDKKKVKLGGTARYPADQQHAHPQRRQDRGEGAAGGDSPLRMDHHAVRSARRAVSSASCAA